MAGAQMPRQMPEGFQQMNAVLLLHGGLDSLTGKTGLAMLRYRSGPIVAVIDPAHAGSCLEQVTGIQRQIPIVASMAEAMPLHPDVAVVGLAPSGGQLPAPVRGDVLAALQAGINIASGLHTRLSDDPELVAACRSNCWIWDLRQEPPGLRVGRARAAALPCHRLLAIGTDMAVGKMSACLELLSAARQRSLPTRFVGTGQAGILIGGGGVALDAVRVDYAAGAVESGVLAAAEPLPPGGLVLVEGQGSLCHPASSATLPLLRGTQPTALLLVHRAGQSTIDRLPEIPLPSLPVLVRQIEALADLARPRAAGVGPRVEAVALNTARLDEDQARRAVDQVVAELGLPCTDPVRWNAEPLLDAVLGSRD